MHPRCAPPTLKLPLLKALLAPRSVFRFLGQHNSQGCCSVTWCKQAWLSCSAAVCCLIRRCYHSVECHSTDQIQRTVVQAACTRMRSLPDSAACLGTPDFLSYNTLHAASHCPTASYCTGLICRFYMSSWDAFAAQLCKPPIFASPHLLLYRPNIGKPAVFKGFVWTLVPSVVPHAPDTSFCLQPCLSKSAVSQWQTCAQHCRNTIHT